MLEKAFKLFSFYIFFTVFLFYGSSLFCQISISSKYIEVLMDSSSGRFYIATILGDPENKNDDKKKILFDKIPPTTYPSLFVDVEGFAVGTDDGYFENYPSFSKNRLVWTWRPKKFDKIKMVQIIEIVTNPFTLREDMVRISYIVVNEDSKDHVVSVRLILDTILGESEDAPFFVPPFGKIDKEVVFYKGNMPYLWYSFDSLKSPKVRTMGIVSGVADVTVPSMLVFANWRKLSKTKWDYVPEVGESFGGGLFGGRDTAVGIYFDQIKLKPQEITFYSTMFGLYGDTLKSFDNFSISVVTPEVVKEFPFTLSSVVENNSLADVRDLKVQLIFDTNVFYITNDSTFYQSNLKVKDSFVSSWQVFGQSSLTSGEYEIAVRVSGVVVSTNFDETVYRKFKVLITTNEEKNIVVSLDGLKQTNISQTTVSGNITVTNYFYVTNYFTNYFTNVYNQFGLGSVESINNLIDMLNYELDYLITTYHITSDAETRRKLKERIEVIKSQIQVEKEKLKIIIGE
ncbi:MAG: hypothetical protein ACK4F9_02945 [Brevinematia bacterium]